MDILRSDDYKVYVRHLVLTCYNIIHADVIKGFLTEQCSKLKCTIGPWLLCVYVMFMNISPFTNIYRYFWEHIVFIFINTYPNDLQTQFL